ncbi:RpoS-dependent hydroperoxidase II [Klebsiella pneumoniae]|uniref:RpoS-dependent hydroperoxidase II n=1 Tax=Klebsiella pneumoniae TaxID=573 RepID=A0A377TSM7_KLEPN|nr:RpoS-dependent hydroperoxidase II [Klebsiella pneumoniae]
MRRQLTSVLQVPTQGEEGVIVTDALDTPAADKLLALMTAHRVWSRSPKIAAYSGVVKKPGTLCRA